MSWEQCWEYDRIANERFWGLFDAEKAEGHSDGEGARRVLCGANAEKLNLSHKRDAGEIGDDEYIDAMSIAQRVAVQACRLWDRERAAGRA